MASDDPVIRGRLRQELGLSAKSISTDLLETMRRLRRRDLRAGAPSRAAKHKAAS